MKAFQFLTLFVIAGLLAGCGSTPPAAKTQPHVGMTKDEVVASYGKPGKMSRSDEGEVWIYDNAALAAVPFNFGWRPKFHRFIFDVDGKVSKFSVDDF